MEEVPTISKGYLAGKSVSASTFQREFELDDVLEYVKTGIGSIIEDEVTQRFDSEELKVRETTKNYQRKDCWSTFSRGSSETNKHGRVRLILPKW